MNASKEVIGYVELHLPYPTYFYYYRLKSASLITGDEARHVDTLFCYHDSAPYYI